jgi:PPOX class probable F420-dependent enzyme
VSADVLTVSQREFLNHQRVARLATLGNEGYPEAVPICFACVEGVIYTPIDEKPKSVPPASLRRVRNILARPEVCVVWDHYEEDWKRLAWLQVTGRASLVEDRDERARALNALRGRYPQYREMDLESRPLIKITPVGVRSWSGAPPLTNDGC